MSADRRAGFTLLEVLVALAIAGLALVVLFRAGGEGLFSVDTAGRAEEAVERARSHLAAVGHNVSLLPGDSEGDDGGGYHWRLRIHPAANWQVAAANGAAIVTTLFDVTVEISWSGHGHSRSVVLRTRRVGASEASDGGADGGSSGARP